ncbi:MAG: hypothetical protein K9N38_06850 [Candidatus Marinimicrobia bacterium]|nr:hypothetical protein [Candidatus Neomarinimicrobiota bacterium]
MNETVAYKLFWIPIFIIGVFLMILGPRWMIVEEPWLLDQVANEAALGMSFQALFSADINHSLPDYLRIIYRFFGLWVTAIGVLFCSVTLAFELKAKLPRYIVLWINALILLSSLYLGYTKIPSSPFIYLMWFFVGLNVLSNYGSFRLDRLQGKSDLE